MEFDELPSRLNKIPMPDMVITKEIIECKLARLKTDKSPGLDQLHPRVLYECRDIISYPLYIIYMRSLSLGILPTDWKLAEVTALYKGYRFLFRHFLFRQFIFDKMLLKRHN